MSKRVVCEWCGHSKSIAKDVDKAYAKGRADAIDELTKALIQEIQYKPYMCLDSKDIREIAKQLKENTNAED